MPKYREAISALASKSSSVRGRSLFGSMTEQLKNEHVSDLVIVRRAKDKRVHHSVIGNMDMGPQCYVAGPRRRRGRLNDDVSPGHDPVNILCAGEIGFDPG